jgi:hypothetical protein
MSSSPSRAASNIRKNLRTAPQGTRSLSFCGLFAGTQRYEDGSSAEERGMGVKDESGTKEHQGMEAGAETTTEVREVDEKDRTHGSKVDVVEQTKWQWIMCKK